MAFCFLDAWHEFLPREGGHVVAVCGGGGKTSLLRAAAIALRSVGALVAVTTTTRTEPLDWPGMRVASWPEVADGALRDEPWLFVRGGEHADGKWRGLAPEQADALGGLLPRHVVLVEADGSAGRPVKLLRDDEPVWPARTSLAIVVMGLSAVGRPIGAVLHRHGRLPAPWLPDDPAAVWSWDLMFRLLHGAGGYLAHVPAGVPVVVALTQLAACADSVGLFGFVGRIMDEAGLPLIVLAELAGAQPHLRTTCRLDDDGPAAPPPGGAT
ncbi:MAG: selenium cofactor biosynthesis protein YqeC [Candidatus Krumholzibacteriia bacterium]